MKHIMLDLETMGTGNKAAIVAIGLCVFDPLAQDVEMGIGKQLCMNVDLSSSMDYGLEVDPSTIMWWLEQSDAARTALKTEPRRTLRDALSQMTTFIENVSSRNARTVAIWGNGSTFDNVIIRAAYKAVGMSVPWAFQNDKCYRTVLNLLPREKQPPYDQKGGTAHNALDDAIQQARRLQRVFAALDITTA